ncbi:MAG: IS630 family transposase [Thermodesulfobacteriota bacterium]
MVVDDARKLPPAAQESIRMRAVQAVLDGKTRVEAAAIFGVSRVAIWKWLKAYHADGPAALKAKPQGRPQGGGRLKSHQAAWVARQVRGRYPDQLRLPFMLWTRGAVATLIERKFGIRLALSTIGRYLRTWGFSPQKPVRRAYEQNPAQVRYWLQTKYSAIRRQAKEVGARIYWGDEMGLRSDHAVGRTWGVKGKPPVVKASGNRFSCNMISGITNQGHLSFMVSEGRVTPVRSPESNGMAEAFVRTFKRDYVYVQDRPDARTVLGQPADWFEDYNERHPHKGLRMKAPREFIRSLATAECPV